VTASGVSIDSAPGTGGMTRDFGVTHCDPIKATVDKLVHAASGQRRTSVDPVSTLLGTVTKMTPGGVPLVGSFTNPQVTGASLAPSKVSMADRHDPMPPVGPVDLSKGPGALLGGLPGLTAPIPEQAARAMPWVPRQVGVPTLG
jgi:hypothetical protein